MANKNESRKFNRKIGTIKKGYIPANNWIKTSNNEIIKRWKENFQEQLHNAVGEIGQTGVIPDIETLPSEYG